MIFVTVGTHTEGFDRLVKAADDYAAISDEKVVIQRGSSRYIPEHAENFQWAPAEVLSARIREARIVISHAGAGTIIQVLQIGRPLIIAPRLKRYGENSNDHQYQLAQALDDQGRAILLADVDCAGVQKALGRIPKLERVDVNSNQLVMALKDLLDKWSGLNANTTRVG